MTKKEYMKNLHTSFVVFLKRISIKQWTTLKNILKMQAYENETKSHRGPRRSGRSRFRTDSGSGTGKCCQTAKNNETALFRFMDRYSGTFAAPIALPLALGILAVIGAVILGILAVVGGILISALAAIAGSVLGIIGGIAIIPQTFGGGLVTIGLSLMLIGCGILVTYFTILLARWAIIKLAGLLGRLSQKRKDEDMKKVKKSF